MRPWTLPLAAMSMALVPAASPGQSAEPPSPIPAPPSPNLPDPGQVAIVSDLIDQDLPTLGPIRELVNLPTAVFAARRNGPRPVMLYESALSGPAAQPGPVADRPPGLPGLVPDLTARARMIVGGGPNRPNPGPAADPPTSPTMTAASPRLTWRERFAGLVPSSMVR